MRFFKVICTICIVLFCTTFDVQSQVTVVGANPATPNGVFATLGAAFSAINSSNQAGLNITVNITSNTIEGVGAVLNQNAGPWASLTIQPAGNVSVSGTIAGTLVDFNGADNLLINGINNVANSLTFENTSNSTLASTIRFVNDAKNNTLTNCLVKGSSTGVPTVAGDGAVVFIAGTSVSSAVGNDNISINNNEITASTTIPFVLIKGFGAASSLAGNSGVVISNNLIHDFFCTVNSHCRGIYVGNGNTGWTLSTNRIYQTADRQWLTGSQPNVYACIDINNSLSGNGNNFIISGNILGFRNSSGTGYSVLKNGGTSGTNIASNIHVVILNALNSVNNIIENNVIGGFDLKSSRATSVTGENIFIGIFIKLGAAIVQNNQIGSSLISNSIIIRSTATTAPNPVPAVGIYNRGTTSNTIINNQIGGFTMSFESPGNLGSDRISLIGILSDNSGLSNIRNNQIGGTNSSNMSSPFLNARLVGIMSTAGISKITGNSVQNLNHAGKRIAFSGQNSNVVGILVTPGSVGDSISQNTITDLSSNDSTLLGTKSIVGIYVDGNGAGLGTIVSKNIIHSFNTAVGPGSKIGITTYAGRTKISNNMISLGEGSTGNDIIFGIEQNLATNVEAYYNTVKISGTSVGVVTAAYRSNCSTTFPGIALLRNNIFYNDRIGISYGYHISAFTTYSGDHNLIYGTRFGFYQGIAYNTIATWFGATGQDGPAVTKNSVMTFFSPTDLHTNDPIVRNSAVSIPGIIDDIDDFARGSCLDIGADEFDPSTIPGTAYSWVGGVSDLWCEPCNWNRDAAPPANSDVIINDQCLNYPLLQTSCGNQQVNNFTMLPGVTAAGSSKMDMGTYTLSVNGNVDIEGTCSCSGVTNSALVGEGLLDVTSTTTQQILDIKNSAGNYPGELCKLRINKIAPSGIASNAHEAILKGNLRILYHLDFTNGVLLSQTGAGYDANENTAANFKTITVLNNETSAVTRQTIAGQNKRNGFFMGRINRAIEPGSVSRQYLFPLGFRNSGGMGVTTDYFYAPSLLRFTNVTNPGFVVGTYLDNNSNFTVDGVNIGFTGHGCFNALEIDDAGGNTAVTCLNKEIDMMALNYWDFSESSGALADGEPGLLNGVLGSVNFDLQCAGDVFALTAVDGLAGSELRLMKRTGVVLPGNAGQGPWVSTVGTHTGTNLSANPGMNMYSLGLLQGAARLDVTQFGGFGGAGNGESPLPVELLFFDANKKNNEQVLCSWATASEINSDYFVVEAAIDYDQKGMLIFKDVGRVKAAGNSTGTINYSLLDDTGYLGLVYYRLKQVDFDGTEVYSSIVSVKFEIATESFIVLGFAPNPATSESELSLYIPSSVNLNLNLSDPAGRVLWNKKYRATEGLEKIKIFQRFLPAAGIYFLQVSIDEKKEVFKIVIP